MSIGCSAVEKSHPTTASSSARVTSTVSYPVSGNRLNANGLNMGDLQGVTPSAGTPADAGDLADPAAFADSDLVASDHADPQSAQQSEGEQQGALAAAGVWFTSALSNRSYQIGAGSFLFSAVAFFILRKKRRRNAGQPKVDKAEKAKKAKEAKAAKKAKQPSVQKPVSQPASAASATPSAASSTTAPASGVIKPAAAQTSLAAASVAAAPVSGVIKPAAPRKPADATAPTPQAPAKDAVNVGDLADQPDWMV